MRYCKKCLQPDTRPGIYFNDDGICGACLWEEEKKNIDWKAREQELRDIADNAKCRAKGAYDCVVGVSGGKDSTLQAFYARDLLGLRTLLVNCEPDNITEIGRKNIENLKNHGFDVISISPNRNLMKKLMIRDFWKYLNPIKVSEYPLYASAYIIADKFSIPLIIQGENAALTLGASKGLQDKGGSCFNIVKSNTLKHDPFEEYLEDGIDISQLFFYKVPVDELLQKDFQGVWLNYYYKDWSPENNAVFSKGKGLTMHSKDVSPFELGDYRKFSQLDSSLVACNQYFKYIKLGFGRVTDAVCYDIRSGRITRDEGKYLVKELDGQCGQFYINEMCRALDLDEKTMFAHAEKFRGDMFYQNEQGNWRLKNPIWEQEPIEGDYRLSEIIRRLEI